MSLIIETESESHLQLAVYVSTTPTIRTNVRLLPLSVAKLIFSNLFHQVNHECIAEFIAQKMKKFPADLVTFTKEIFNRKLHFLCSDLTICMTFIQT